MSIKRGDRVTLVCAGKAATGEVILCSDNTQSLGIRLDDSLQTPGGIFLDFVPLLMKDGLYRDVLHNQVIEVARTQ